MLLNEKGKGSELGSSQSEGLSILPGRCRGAVTGTLEAEAKADRRNSALAPHLGHRGAVAARQSKESQGMWPDRKPTVTWEQALASLHSGT